MPLKIIHCADLHIGAAFHDLSSEKAAIRKTEVYDSFSSIIEFAREKNADMLLICGDLFDSPYPSREDIDFVIKAFMKIRHIPIYISCGNHDYMNVDSVFFTCDFGENVHVFPVNEHSFSLPEKNAVIWGMSFPSKTVLPSFEGFNASLGKYNILCLHGDLTTGSDYNIISKNTLAGFGADYCALGHIHSFEKFSVGKTLCAYPGTPEGHGFDDSGKTGFIYAEIEEENVSIKPVDFSKRHYIKHCIDISDYTTNIEIIEALRNLISENDLYKIELSGALLEDFSVSTAHIENILSAETFYISVKDCTSLKENPLLLLNEKSLRGDFLRNLKSVCRTDDEFELAAKIGLNALSGIKTEF